MARSRDWNGRVPCYFQGSEIWKHQCSAQNMAVQQQARGASVVLGSKRRVEAEIRIEPQLDGRVRFQMHGQTTMRLGVQNGGERQRTSFSWPYLNSKDLTRQRRTRSGGSEEPILPLYHCAMDTVDKSVESKHALQRRSRRVFDWLFVLIVLGGGTIALDRFLPPRIYRINLDDPRVQLPIVKEIVPTYALGLLALLLPAATFCVFEFALLRRPHRFFSAFGTFFLGLGEACGFTLIATNALKLVVGRPRPYFKELCQGYPDQTSATCIGSSGSDINDARKSFPSGHSSLAFACFVYLGLYMGMRMRITNPSTGFKSAKFLVLCIPVSIASFVAVSRVLDYHHNYDDIVAGSVLGAAFALAIWHARWNEVQHICSGGAPQSEEEILPITNDVPGYTGEIA